MSATRSWFKIGLGAIQIGLGVYIALRPMLANNRVLTGQAWLDAAFAFFFIVRGAMNVRSAWRVKQAPGE